MGEAGMAFLAQTVRLWPKMYLREYVKIMTEGGFIVSEGLVCEALAQMKLTIKKVRPGGVVTRPRHAFPRVPFHLSPCPPTSPR